MPVFAASDTSSAETVFPSEELEKLEQEIESEDVEADKENDLATNYVASIGRYPTRKGVILVTKDKYKGLIPTGHAAIVWSSESVIEATASGVGWGKNNWNTKKKTCYGMTVKSTSAKNDRGAANWCREQIGKPYNYNYYNVTTREKFYCSQLVWAAYKDKYGVNLNTSKFGVAIHPMELVKTPKTKMIYKK